MQSAVILKSSFLTVDVENKDQLLNKEPDVPIFDQKSCLAIIWEGYQDLTPEILKIVPLILCNS